jgi:uncharacterized protein (TIGR02145 family)
MKTKSFFKLFMYVDFALATVLLFSSCDVKEKSGTTNGMEQTESSNSKESIITGIGELTATTDPGVKIGNIIWATRNVDESGTFTENPQDYGKLYQWNRPTAWAATDNTSDWDSILPAGIEWESQNDPCPEGWRVATHAEQQALVAIGSTWVLDWNNTGVAGRVFGSDENSIFLPATGYLSGLEGSLNNNGTGYWSSTQDGRHYAYRLGFNNGSLDTSGKIRNCGFSVRCVAGAK